MAQAPTLNATVLTKATFALAGAACRWNADGA